MIGLEKFMSTLVHLNWHHGRGRITGITLLECEPTVSSSTPRISGQVTRWIPTTSKHGFSEIRKFRIVNDTIHFLGRQRRLSGARL